MHAKGSVQTMFLDLDVNVPFKILSNWCKISNFAAYSGWLVFS